MTTAAPEAPTLEKKLETVMGDNLLDSFRQLEPDSIRHAYEIVNEKRTNDSLRDAWSWTADFLMYRLENEKGEQDANGEAVLYFAPGKHNLVFRHLEDAMDDAHPISQLRIAGNYKPNATEVQEVVDSAKTKETLRVKLADLNLQIGKRAWSFFVIDTAKYANSVEKGGLGIKSLWKSIRSLSKRGRRKNYAMRSGLNAAQRELAERAYGRGQDFVENMAMLNQAGQRNIDFYVLNQEYVKANAQESAISGISIMTNPIMTCRITHGDYSSFEGGCNQVGGIQREAPFSFANAISGRDQIYYGGLRGVLKKNGVALREGGPGVVATRLFFHLDDKQQPDCSSA